MYLEDLEGPAKTSQEKVAPTAVRDLTAAAATTATATDNAEATAKSPAGETKTDTGATKRQRSLMEMFSKAPSAASTSSSPAAKRPRKTLSASPSLNSIPFSLSEYQSSFSDEEKKLLALECETMGKSW